VSNERDAAIKAALVGMLREHVSDLRARVAQAVEIFPDEVPLDNASPVQRARAEAFYGAARDGNIQNRVNTVHNKLVALDDQLTADPPTTPNAMALVMLTLDDMGRELAYISKWATDTRRKIAQSVAQCN